MASQILTCNAGTDQGGGTGTAWATPGNITAQDGVGTTSADTTDFGSTPKLRGTFGFSIPTGATVNGITLNVKVKKTQNSTSHKWNSAQLVKAGALAGTNKNPATELTFNAYTLISAGSTSDLWGTTWTPAEINAANFGAQIGFLYSNAVSKSWGTDVDYVEISVDYTLAADSTPDAFTFTDVSGVEVSSYNQSAPITVTGINVPANISVSGGEYYVSGQNFWRSDASTVNLNDAVYARPPGGSASSQYSTALNAVVTIGGVSDTYTVTTRAADITPNAFSFVDQTNVALNTVIQSGNVTIGGMDAGQASPISVTGGEYGINGGAYTSSAGSIFNGNTVQVRHTSSNSVSTAVNTVLTINGVSDTFTSTTLATDTRPAAFGDYTSVINAVPGSLVQSLASKTISGIPTPPSAASVNIGQFDINASGNWLTSGTVTNADTIRVRVNASNNDNATVVQTLAVGGITGTFSVTSGLGGGFFGDVF